MTKLQQALAAGRISQVAELVTLGDDSLALRAYCHLCSGHPEKARALLSGQIAHVGDALLKVIRMTNVFDESAAIHHLPEPKPGGAQSPERPDEIYDELRDLPKNVLLSDLQDMERLAQRQPEDAVLSFRLGEIFGFRKKDVRKGRLYLEAAVRADPGRALFWGYTAELIYKAFSAFEAVDYYNAAVFLDPDNPRWRMYRSIVLVSVFLLSMSESASLVLDMREEIAREARLAVGKAAVLGEEYRILEACTVHLAAIESQMPSGRLPNVLEVLLG